MAMSTFMWILLITLGVMIWLGWSALLIVFTWMAIKKPGYIEHTNLLDGTKMYISAKIDDSAPIAGHVFVTKAWLGFLSKREMIPTPQIWRSPQTGKPLFATYPREASADLIKSTLFMDYTELERLKLENADLKVKLELADHRKLYEIDDRADKIANKVLDHLPTFKKATKPTGGTQYGGYQPPQY